MTILLWEQDLQVVLFARRLIDATDATVLLIEAGNSDIQQENIVNPDNWIYTLGGRKCLSLRQ